jgi:hypothetical protein
MSINPDTANRLNNYFARLPGEKNGRNILQYMWRKTANSVDKEVNVGSIILVGNCPIGGRIVVQ